MYTLMRIYVYMQMHKCVFVQITFIKRKRKWQKENRSPIA